MHTSKPENPLPPHLGQWSRRRGGCATDWEEGWCSCGGEVEESREMEADTYEDVHPQQIMPTPDLPSRAVIEEHRIDHWPPRTWCDECNEGHGRERRHGKVSEQHRVAIASLDYAFITRNGSVIEEGDPGWDDEEALKLLIVKDSLSRSVFAHAVPKKGVDDKRFAVDIIVEYIYIYIYIMAWLRQSDPEAR